MVIIQLSIKTIGSDTVDGSPNIVALSGKN
jgi:hypothetical protein